MSSPYTGGNAMSGKQVNGISFTMNDDYYPGLFRGADLASISAQETYFLLQRVYLGSLIIGGILGALTSLFHGSALTWIYTSMAAVLSVGLLVLWIGRARQDDKI